jgi:hypothetical protein
MDYRDADPAVRSSDAMLTFTCSKETVANSTSGSQLPRRG